jgi:ribosome-binding protein aMBF1 (putative translation factor)
MESTMSRVQFITTPKGETLAVMPVEDYEALAEAAEPLDEAEEEALAAEMRRLRAEDRGEPLGLAEFRRILAGESPVRVWREHRGLSLRALAARLGMSAGYISDIEAGKKDGSIETLRAIASELGASMDDLTRPR